MTVDLVVDKAGVVTLLVHEAGTGYADNDEVWVEFREVNSDASITDAATLFGIQVVGEIDWNILVVGGNAAKVATFKVDGLMGAGGDISLLAFNHEFVQGAFYTVTTNAQIDIHNATLHGRNVSVRADANNNDVTALIDTIEDGALGEDWQWLVDLGNSLGIRSSRLWFCSPNTGRSSVSACWTPRRASRCGRERRSFPTGWRKSPPDRTLKCCLM